MHVGNKSLSYHIICTSPDCLFEGTHCKKTFVILTIVFLTRIATVDMVLWDDTRIVHLFHKDTASLSTTKKVTVVCDLKVNFVHIIMWSWE